MQATVFTRVVTANHNCVSSKTVYSVLLENVNCFNQNRLTPTEHDLNFTGWGGGGGRRLLEKGKKKGKRGLIPMMTFKHNLYQSLQTH